MITGTFDALADVSTGITVDAAVLSTGPDAASYLVGLEPGLQQKFASLTGSHPLERDGPNRCYSSGPEPARPRHWRG